MALRLLVTGASGFIGAALVPALAMAGHRVRAASRLRPSVLPANVEWAHLPDLQGPIDWNPLLTGIDVVVHLAGMAHRSDLDSSRIDKVNRDAVAMLVEACKRTAIKRLIYISSAGVLSGATSEFSLSERDVPVPMTAYDRAKLAAEEVVMASGVPYTILRPVVVYGVNAKANFALMLRLARLSCPLPFRLLSGRRSLLAIENFISAVEVCLEATTTENEIFLVADPEPISIAGMITELRCGLGRRPLLVGVPPEWIRRGLLMVGRGDIWDRIGRDFVVDTQKLRNVGWQPPVTTGDGLRAIGALHKIDDGRGVAK